MTVAVSGDSITFPDNSVQATAPKVGMVNRIINGAMVINQRAASITSSGYSVDRFEFVGSVASKATISQDTSVYPTGFKTSLKALSSSAYTVGASEVFMFRQPIEGFNTADLDWGTANAKTITISFLAYSSLTGTFGGAVENSDGNRCYVFSYSIPVANTWTQVSVTIAGDTTGTWIGATNGIGLRVAFSFGTGATLSGTAGAWGTTRYFAPTGATSVVGTSGATFYITGVQLEKGSTATSFDYRPYGTEMLLAQRYYQRVSGFVCGTGTNTGACGASVMYKTEMRASPSVGLTATLVVTQAQTSDFTQSSASALIAAGGTRVNSLGVSLDFANFTGLPNNTPLPAIVTGGILTLSSEL